MKKLFGVLVLLIVIVGCDNYDDVPVYHEITDNYVVICPEPPIEIMSNLDEESVSHEDRVLDFFNIIQVKEDLFYMYYETWRESLEEFDQKVCFAYSNDCIHWTKKFPNHTDSNNVIIPSNCIGMSVMTVPDEYAPYRMIGFCKKENGGYALFMWKSKDGLSFTDKKEIYLKGDFDTQSVGVLKGDMIKLYTRTRKKANGGYNRKISITYLDLEGNAFLKPLVLQYDYLYNSAASPLNEKYDLLLPTHFNNAGTGNDNAYVEALICSDFDSKKIDCNINDWIGDNEPWMAVAPGILNIGGEQYISYVTHSWSHDTPYSKDGVSKMYLLKIRVEPQ